MTETDQVCGAAWCIDSLKQISVMYVLTYKVRKHEHSPRRSTVVKVLCYKSEGRWFDPSWCQWIFH